MQTKKALGILNKNAESNQTSLLSDKAEKYKADYDARENELIAKRSEAQLVVPFVNAIKRKVAKIVETPDGTIPVVASYDLYSGIRKLAERSPKDNGLTRLATHLEKVWKADPLGTLSYDNVSAITAQFKDQYPRSKAADAIEAECARVGFHKLPVAKLARLAAKVDSQDTYDFLMESNGLGGSRADQVRSRAFVRGLVAMQAGLDVDHHPVKAKDTRSSLDKVSDHLASLNKNADYNFALELLQDANSLASTLENALSQASQEALADGFEDAGQALHDLSVSLNSWMGGLTDASDRMQMLDEQPSVSPPAALAPVDDPKKDEQEFLDMGKKNLQKNVEKQDMADAGIGKKWYDPRTWGHKPASLIKQGKAVLDSKVSNAIKAEVFDFIEKLAQIPPMMEDDKDMQMSEDVQPMDDAVPAMDMLPAESESAPLDQPGLDQGVDIVKEIDEMAQEVIQNAPPAAQSYIEHETAEGHTAPPGTAEWGAEEVLNEGHEFAPPTDGWLAEEMEEMGLENSAPAEESAPVDMPAFSAAKKETKGMPMPGKIKQQIDVSTYAKKVTPDGAAKVLKASELEDRLLDGEKVVYGPVSMFINASDEVELWNKTSGVACPLSNMDIAIADFLKLASKHDEFVRSSAVKFTYSLGEVVNVPCEVCSNVYVFPKAASLDDHYVCECGYEISARVMDEIIKLGGSSKAFQLQVQYPVSDDPVKNKQMYERVMRAVNTAAPGSMKVDEEGRGFVTATLWNVDEHDVEKFSRSLQALGATSESRRVAQNAPAAPAPVGQPLPTAGGDQLPAMPLGELANAAFMNYKAQGLSFPEAMQAFVREHKERLNSAGPDAAGEILGAMAANYTSGMPAAPAAEPAPAPEAAPAPPAAPVAPVASKSADKMKVPSVRKPKDHVKVDKSPGKDTAGEDLLPNPGKIKTQQGKPDGKLSDTKMQPDSSGKDLLPSPGAIKTTHDPKSQSGIKLPNKKLDKDLAGEDAFKAPALGSSPSVKK